MTRVIVDPSVTRGVRIRDLPHGLQVHEVNGSASGPTLAVLGGVHGDEDLGVLATHCFLHTIADELRCGTVRAVAPANPDAWQRADRLGSDGSNMAREFPGHRDGSPAQQRAAVITEYVIRGADILVDLHTAGRNYSMPFLCGYVDDPAQPWTARAAAAAYAFGAPLVWRHPAPGSPGRSLSAAAAHQLPAIYVEADGVTGRAGQLTSYVTGLRRVAALLGMLPPDTAAPASVSADEVAGDGDLDRSLAAVDDGFAVIHVLAGDPIAPGQPVVDVYDQYGKLVHSLRAERAGTVMFVRRTMRVARGDLLVALAGPRRPLTATAHPK